MSLETQDLILSYGARNGGTKNGAAKSSSAKTGSTKNGDKKIGAVLEGVSLSVLPGQVLALQGPNGSGKSTLMKALARQLAPAGGRVMLDGQDIWQSGVLQFARKVAYVPQSLNPPAAMTVAELVALGRAPHQKIFQLSLNEKDQAVVYKSLERCGLIDLREKLVGEISGGEKQRAFIAMALSQEPAYLLLDEPTASLDFRFQLELIELLGQLKQEGLGVALIVHDLNVAAHLADNVALLAPGANPGEPSHVVAQGKVEDVFSRDMLRRVFAVDIEYISNGARQFYFPAALEKA